MTYIELEGQIAEILKTSENKEDAIEKVKDLLLPLIPLPVIEIDCSKINALDRAFNCRITIKREG